MTAGHWFGAGNHGSGRSAADPVEISVESDLAKELGVGLGDQITWDVQGVPVYSRITSLRDVNWARFEPNFFVVFAPGALEHAPQTWVTMVRAPDPAIRGRLQREVVEHAANVTAIDLGEIQHAIESVVDRIVMAIRFMALFSIITGTIVLVGAIATSRWQRVREGTLLRTLGATRRQVLIILCVEYAALGLAASIVASALAGGAGWALARWIFAARFVLPARIDDRARRRPRRAHDCHRALELPRSAQQTTAGGAQDRVGTGLSLGHASHRSRRKAGVCCWCCG